MAYTDFGSGLIAVCLLCAQHHTVETPGPSEKPSAEFATLKANAMACFGCSQTLETTPRQLPGGQWVADCAECGVTNKLRQDTENPVRFSVAGALIPIRRGGHS